MPAKRSTAVSTSSSPWRAARARACSPRPPAAARRTRSSSRRSSLPGGKGVAIKKIPGNLKFNDITLKRGIDSDNELWQWRQLVVDGKVKEARCDGQIQILDSEFKPVATYAFERGWVSKYTPAGMNAGQDQAAVEEITICVENYKRA